MAYCSAQDIRNALAPDGPNGTNGKTNTAADMSDVALLDSADQASAIVDSYIDGPYAPGVDPAPPAIIRFWARDIGAYLASLVYRESKAPAANNPVVLRYNNALAMLQAFAAGDLTVEAPGNVDDQPTVINPLPGNLIGPGEFNLFGRQEGYQGWPLYRQGAEVYWHDGYPY